MARPVAHPEILLREQRMSGKLVQDARRVCTRPHTHPVTLHGLAHAPDQRFQTRTLPGRFEPLHLDRHRPQRRVDILRSLYEPTGP